MPEDCATPRGRCYRCSPIDFSGGTTQDTSQPPHPSLAWAGYDLSRTELASIQRAVAHLARRGSAPSPDEFWRSTAVPRAQRLLDHARRAIDAQMASTGDGPVGARPAVGVTTAGIDELGRWWLRRLRRAAFVRALPELSGCLPAEIHLRVSHHEMRLLDTTPWAHGDRLLSAYELAYREIVRHHRHRLTEVATGEGAAPGTSGWG